MKISKKGFILIASISMSLQSCKTTNDNLNATVRIDGKKYQTSDNVAELFFKIKEYCCFLDIDGNNTENFVKNVHENRHKLGLEKIKILSSGIKKAYNTRVKQIEISKKKLEDMICGECSESDFFSEILKIRLENIFARYYSIKAAEVHIPPLISFVSDFCYKNNDNKTLNEKSAAYTRDRQEFLDKLIIKAFHVFSKNEANFSLETIYLMCVSKQLYPYFTLEFKEEEYNVAQSYETASYVHAIISAILKEDEKGNKVKTILSKNCTNIKIFNTLRNIVLVHLDKEDICKYVKDLVSFSPEDKKELVTVLKRMLNSESVKKVTENSDLIAATNFGYKLCPITGHLYLEDVKRIVSLPTFFKNISKNSLNRLIDSTYERMEIYKATERSSLFHNWEKSIDEYDKIIKPVYKSMLESKKQNVNVEEKKDNINPNQTKISVDLNLKHSFTIFPPEESKLNTGDNEYIIDVNNSFTIPNYCTQTLNLNLGESLKQEYPIPIKKENKTSENKEEQVKFYNAEVERIITEFFCQNLPGAMCTEAENKYISMAIDAFKNKEVSLSKKNQELLDCLYNQETSISYDEVKTFFNSAGLELSSGGATTGSHNKVIFKKVENGQFIKITIGGILNAVGEKYGKGYIPYILQPLYIRGCFPDFINIQLEKLKKL